MWYKVVSIIKLTSHMVVYAAIWLCLCSRISQNPIIYHHFHSFSLFRSGWWFQPLWKILINEKDYPIYSWVLYPPPRPNRHTQYIMENKSHVPNHQRCGFLGDPSDTPNGCCHHFPSRGRPGNPSCQPDLEERPLEPSHGATAPQATAERDGKGKSRWGNLVKLQALRVSFPW